MRNSRDVMRKGEKITLYEEDSDHKKVFVISARDGEGASTVSYLASRGTKTGRLKEFYPCEETRGKDVSISRRKDNQLCWSSDDPQAASDYLAMQEEYVQAYHILEQAKNEAKKTSGKGHNLLSSFIPSFEIYRSCGENGEKGSGVYIWTPDNDGAFETFDRYLEKVHKAPRRNPTKALVVILQALYNLTECIKVLHTLGLIHSDIKPANFGCSIRDGRYLTEQIQLFDINSVYSVFTKFPNFTGTRGFCAPEVFRGKITNQSDLYSIGAVLFHAVAVPDREENVGRLFPSDGLYDDDYYDRIDEIVEHSKLINASPVTANIQFRGLIAQILKKCLARELRHRVDNCDELKNDLLRACVLLLPEQYSNSLDLGKRLKVIDEELERYEEADAIFAMQSLLFDHPLYKAEGDTVKVCVAGFGVYGQRFLDLCLQAGQICGKKLEITVVTQNKEVYKKEYLDSRPAMTDFFEIDGEGDRSDTGYGKIVFVTPQEACGDKEGKYAGGFDRTNTDYNKQLAAELMKRCGAGYIFIALGEDKRNEAVAKVCAACAKRYEMDCTVAYVCSENKKQADAVAVNVTAKATENASYKHIERMAFNVHLAWNSPLRANQSIEKIRRQFADPYNHDSSVACVLAIRNVFYACGIEWNDFSPEATAKALKCFTEKLETDGKEGDEKQEALNLLASLIWNEHRRWVVDRITQGWVCKTDLTACEYEPPNDKKKKQHVCILKSRPDFELATRFKKSPKKWNEPCDDERALDELDTMSVMLHRVYVKAAERIRSEFTPDGEEAYRIRRLIRGNKAMEIAFDEWMVCLKRIWNKDETQTKFYDGYRDTFTGLLKKLSRVDREDANRYVGILDAKAKLLIEAYRMRDYKATDEALIRKIPFILTHREDCRMFVPLTTGDNTAKFRNVAAVTVVDPELVVYGAYIRDYGDIRETMDALDGILAYMEKKGLKAKLKVVLLYIADDQSVAQFIPDLVTDIKSKNKRIRQVLPISVGYETEIAAAIAANVQADVYEQNRSYLSGLLNGALFYQDRPSYEFDSVTRAFRTTENCAWLNYVDNQQFIRVADMLAFKRTKGVMNAMPEYTEYKNLWQWYRKIYSEEKDDGKKDTIINSSVWKSMCRLLEKYAESHDVIASFQVARGFTNTEKLEYVIPSELRNSFCYILSRLIEGKAIDEGSAVEYKTTDSCLVTIYVEDNNKAAVKKLFEDPYRMINVKDISVSSRPRKLDVLFDNRVVKGLDVSSLPDDHDQRTKVCGLLEELEKYGLIHSLERQSDNVLSFVYATVQAKQLMTIEGRLLEIYVYHKLLEAGFDDVVCGYEINWGDTTVMSEFDCIVTSGFQCAIIECKAQDKIDQDYYSKLFALEKQFGINAIPVLIADTHENPRWDNSDNERQRERGRMMDVVTVYDRGHIGNIGLTLRNIFKGNYPPRTE